MPELDRAGARVYYARSGTGAPALVLVHGFACDHSDWQHQVEHFRRGHVVVTPDLRGHGRSRECRAGFDVASYADDIVALMEALSLAPAVLAGHSMGCRVVLEAARRAPAAVAGVVLIDGSKQASGDAETAMRAVREAIAAEGLQSFMARLFGEMFVASSDAAVRQRIMTRAAALPETVAAPLFADMARWDAAEVSAALAALEAPLLVLQSTYRNERRERRSMRAGESSPWLDLLRERAPAARIEVLAGIGHFTMLEAAAAVNEHVQSFIDGLDAGV